MPLYRPAVQMPMRVNCYLPWECDDSQSTGSRAVRLPNQAMWMIHNTWQCSPAPRVSSFHSTYPVFLARSGRPQGILGCTDRVNRASSFLHFVRCGIPEDEVRFPFGQVQDSLGKDTITPCRRKVSGWPRSAMFYFTHMQTSFLKAVGGGSQSLQSGTQTCPERGQLTRIRCNVVDIDSLVH